MDKKEFGMWAMALKTYYPREQLLPNNQAMNLWYRELQDIPMVVAETVLQKWVQTEKWPPTIAEIREMAATVTNGEQMTWGESWEKAVGAIRKFGSYRPKEALESLDPITRKCVESLGYRELCISENTMADRANFRMIYETVANREKMRQQIALPLQQAIDMIQLKGLDEPLKLEGGGEQ